MLTGYLRVLAYKILQGWNSKPFVFVDGLSGPWRSGGADRADTSPHRALTVLTEVVEDLRKRDLDPKVRAVFVERDSKACGELGRMVKDFPLVASTVHHGRFQEHVPRIAEEVRDAFAFVFVDPRGWTGMDLSSLRPLLARRDREVLVNLMAYAVTRHARDRRPQIRATFDRLFGDANWYGEVEELEATGKSLEEALRLTYLDRLRRTCGFRYVVSTRILWPGRDRTYFYLAYGTNSPAGIMVFRSAEEKCVEEQKQIRRGTRRRAWEARTGGSDLFADQDDVGWGENAFREGREAALTGLRLDLKDWFDAGQAGKREEVFAGWMQRPLVWQSDCKAVVKEAETAGRLRQESQAGNHRLIPLSTPAAQM